MKVPNSISDLEWKKLQARAEKAAPPIFSSQAVRNRKANSARLKNADKN